MKMTTAGIDLAKSIFQVHGVDEHGKLVLRKKLERSKLLEFFIKQQPCLIGMEACGSAHYWARKFVEMGHTVKLMAPQFVKPYVKTNKNDAADAEAAWFKNGHFGVTRACRFRPVLIGNSRVQCHAEGGLPQRRGSDKTDLASLAQHREKLENASHHLACREKPIRHPVRRALHGAPVTKHCN